MTLSLIPLLEQVSGVWSWLSLVHGLDCGFVGGILVACAHFGGYVMGSDIDWNVVHGKGDISHLKKHLLNICCCRPDNKSRFFEQIQRWI